MRPVLLAAALAACTPGGASTSSTSTTTSTSSTSATTDEPTSSGTTDACDGSGECDSEGICVAAYSPSDDPANPGARGPAACTDQGSCIGPLDLTRWCFDHQGCCESLRCRTADGVCEPADLGQTGSESSGAPDTTGTTGTASTDSPATDASTSDTGTTTTGG